MLRCAFPMVTVQKKRFTVRLSVFHGSRCDPEAAGTGPVVKKLTNMRASSVPQADRCSGSAYPARLLEQAQGFYRLMTGW